MHIFANPVTYDDMKINQGLQYTAKNICTLTYSYRATNNE